MACDCASRIFFHMLVMRSIKMTLSGHPCRMPFVAAKKEQRHPIILKQRVSCVYIPDNALWAWVHALLEGDTEHYLLGY